MFEEARDLWLRMAVLDRRCRIDLHGDQSRGRRAEGGLRWRAEVRPRGVPVRRGESPIVAEGETAIAVLLRVVREAERRGWDRGPALSDRGRGAGR